MQSVQIIWGHFCVGGLFLFKGGWIVSYGGAVKIIWKKKWMTRRVIMQSLRLMIYETLILPKGGEKVTLGSGRTLWTFTALHHELPGTDADGWSSWRVVNPDALYCPISGLTSADPAFMGPEKWWNTPETLWRVDFPSLPTAKKKKNINKIKCPRRLQGGHRSCGECVYLLRCLVWLSVIIKASSELWHGAE